MRCVNRITQIIKGNTVQFSWPEQTQPFELDQPQVLEKKDETLRAANAQVACERHVIKIDLNGSWSGALVQGGFDPQKPSGWLFEGFLFYIPNKSITRLLDITTDLTAPGSWLGFDIINSAMLTLPWTKQWIETLAKSGTPWIGTMDEPGESLAQRGWQTGEPDASYGRWPYPTVPLTLPDMPRSWFVTAKKR